MQVGEESFDKNNRLMTRTEILRVSISSTIFAGARADTNDKVHY